MRRILATILSTFSAVAMMLTFKIGLRAPTAEEIALLGPAPARTDVAQLRLARLIVTVDEDRGSQALAALTGADPALVRRNLRAKAGLDAPLAGYAAPEYDRPEVAAGGASPRVRDMPDGGARFIKVD